MDHQESKGLGWDFWEVYESFLLNHEVEICLSSSNNFIDHGAGDIFFFIIYLVFIFFFFAFPFTQSPIFFPNGDVPKLMQLL